MSGQLETTERRGESAEAASERYVAATSLLDFSDPAISSLVDARGWRRLSERERIKAVYDYVRDDVRFGYNASDDLPASAVLREGIGQCNTKATLLMALFRSVGVPCRLHGFTIHSELQKGAIPRALQPLTPEEIIHSWVEINYEGQWRNLEGFILDRPYLTSVQRKFPTVTGPFCGYGIATTDFRSPPIDWTGGDTYIQREGIARNFGVFDDPDSFYATHGTNLRGIKRLLYRAVARHMMNRNVDRLRRRSR